MPRLLAEADEVVKLRAICARCGREASRSQRLIDGRPAPVSAPTILDRGRGELPGPLPPLPRGARGRVPVRVPWNLANRGDRIMPRKYIVVLILFCIALNAAGFIWKIFEPVLFYDELAHFITPFTLVLILAEIIYRSGGDDEFFDTPMRAIITGSVIGLLGATGWEGIEVLMSWMGISVSNTLPDTIFDIFLGVLGGAAGAWAADRYLDRIFRRSRTNANQPRVR